LRVHAADPQAILRFQIKRRSAIFDEDLEPLLTQFQTEMRLTSPSSLGWGIAFGVLRNLSLGEIRDRIYLEPSIRTKLYDIQVRGSFQAAFTWGSPDFPTVYEAIVENGWGITYRWAATRPMTQSISLQVALHGRWTQRLSRLYFQAMVQARF